MIFSIFKKKDFNALNDESLMLHVADGNSEAFNEIYQRYGASMYRYFLRLLNNNQSKAEDFTQDLFIKVMQSANSFDEHKKLRAWLYTIANNMCRNEWRNQSNRAIILSQLEFESIVLQNDHQTIDQKIILRHLDDEIYKLPEADQALITMRYQQELSIQEIADIIDVPEGTVKSRMYYLIKKLSLKLKVFAPNYQS